MTPPEDDDRHTDGAPPDEPQGVQAYGVQPPGYPGDRRFDRGLIVAGVVLGGVVAVGAAFAAVMLAALLGETNPTLGFIAFFTVLLLPPGFGVVATFRGRTAGSRGLALGVLIGWALTAIIGGGACVWILRNLE